MPFRVRLSTLSEVVVAKRLKVVVVAIVLMVMLFIVVDVEFFLSVSETVLELNPNLVAALEVPL